MKSTSTNTSMGTMVQAVKMDNKSSQQQVPKTEAIPNGQSRQTPFVQDMPGRPPFVVGNPSHGQANHQFVNGVGVSDTSGNVNRNAFHKGDRAAAFKLPIHQPAVHSFDGNAYHRPPNAGGLMYVPSGPMIGSVPYTPTGLYSGLVPGHSALPAPGYNFPFQMGGGAVNLSRPRPWASVEEKLAFQNRLNDNAHNGIYPTAPPMERTDGFSFQYNQPLPPIAPLLLPYQMMKTSTGYMVQDLEALTQRDPPIPRAVPAMWTNPSEVTLAKCLENREGITNVYIRGFLPETTDEVLHSYASRFGKIDRCKAIVDLENGRCKGFGFVQFFNFEACENCIRGFYYLGYQASFAQKSRNSRLKDLEDKSSTNIYCTNVPMEWTEADLRRHFEPYRVMSEKISRDEKTGVCKEVGFARFETREIAEQVLGEFHNIVAKDGVKLLLRFADTKAQKLLKQQSNERRAYRTGEYNYSVEVVQGSTPSPSLRRLQQTISHVTPNSPLSYQSPAGMPPAWTPATSISPPALPLFKNSGPKFGVNSWPSRNPLANLDNTPAVRRRMSSVPAGLFNPKISSNTEKASSNGTVEMKKPQSPSPQKENIKAGSVSPMGSPKEAPLKPRKSSC